MTSTKKKKKPISYSHSYILPPIHTTFRLSVSSVGGLGASKERIVLCIDSGADSAWMLFKDGDKSGLARKAALLKTAGFMKVTSFFENNGFSLCVTLLCHHIRACAVGQDGGLCITCTPGRSYSGQILINSACGTVVSHLYGKG